LKIFLQNVIYPKPIKGDTHDQIHNGQVIHYTRMNPMSGEVAPHLSWLRSICSNNLARSNNEWEAIHWKKFSNADLLREVELRHKA